MKPAERAAGALLAAAFAFFLFAALAGFTNEISHLHGFRQAQTLVAVQRMLEGGPWLWYELPVMGEPARLPHEFPLLHWLTIAVSKLSGAGILTAARAVAITYWGLCLLTLASLVRGVSGSLFLTRATLALVLCSPIYVHWSRAAMGETQALFFALAWLECLRRALAGGPGKAVAGWLLAAIAAGSVVALVKALTLFATLPVALALVWRYRAAGGARGARVAAAALTLPLAVAFFWPMLADLWKLANPIAAEVLASRPLLANMMGPWALRFDGGTWSAIWENAFGGLLGSGWAFLAVVVAALFLRVRAPLFLLSVFTAPFLVLTQIYSTHQYYPCAVGIWALAAAAILLERLARRPGRWPAPLAVLLLAGLLALEGSRFFRAYYPLQTVPNAYGRDLGRVLASLVEEHELMLVYGWDYTSEIRWFSGRRTVMNPMSYPPGHPVLERALAATPPYRPAAALFCLGESANERLAAAVVAAYGLDPSPARHRYANCAIYRKPGRAVPPGAILF